MPGVIYLALDQSPKRIGWARASAGDVPTCGVEALPRDGRRDAVFMEAAYVWVRRQIRDEFVTEVVVECAFAGMDPEIYSRSCKLIGAIEWACHRAEVRCREAEPPKWRARFIGRAQAPKSIKGNHLRRKWLKEQAMKACEARGWPVQCDDEAEACGILDYVMALDDPDYGATTGAPLFRGGAS